MKSILSAFSFFILVLFFASCQSGPDDTLDPGNPGGGGTTTSDSTRLKMIIGIDTAFANGIDTSDKYLFQYDASKRLTFIDIYEYEPGQAGVQYHDNEQRFYNGTDTLPYKVVYYVDDHPTLDDIDTVYLTYQNGVIIKDSSISVQGAGNPVRYISVRKYKLLHGMLINANIYSLVGSSLVLTDSITSGQTYLNNNLVHQQDTLFGSGGNEIWDITRAYDNHPSPLQRISLPFPIYNYGFHLAENSFLQFAKSVNNETVTQYLDDGVPDYQENNLIQYKANGYPSIYRLGIPGFTDKIFFTYQE
ncbi:MAG: hypothetical protein ABI480_10190 [Chitinophagaceae bacterium]